MAEYRVFPNNRQWVVIKSKSKGKSLGTYKLRRDAITRAKALAGKNGVVTVHASDGQVIIRIPEIQMVAASVHIKRAADMTPDGRRTVAAWLRQHARDLVKHGKQYSGNFRGRYYCPA